MVGTAGLQTMTARGPDLFAKDMPTMHPELYDALKVFTGAFLLALVVGSLHIWFGLMARTFRMVQEDDRR